MSRDQVVDLLHFLHFGLLLAAALAVYVAIGRRALRFYRATVERRPEARDTVPRLTASVLLVVAGLVHGVVSPDHLADGPVVGAFFVLVTAVQIGLAVLVLRSAPHAEGVAATVSGAVSLTWTVSRTAGLPAMGVEPVGWLDAGVTCLQVVTVLLCLRLRAGGVARATAADGEPGEADQDEHHHAGAEVR